MRKLVGIGIIFLGLFVVACPRSQNTPTNGEGQVAQADEEKDFSTEYLQSLSWTGGLFTPNENVWDVDAYKQYQKYFPLTADEQRVVGAWIPIPEESWTSNKYKAERFGFWPNKLCTAEYGAGYMIGLWAIREGQLVVTIYGFAYPGEEEHYTKERCRPFKVVLCSMSDLSPIGYSRRRLNNVPVPKKIADRFPDAILEGRAYHFKALAFFEPSTGIEFPFMNSMKQIIEAGNPSAEDIVTLKAPNAKDLW